MDSILPYITAVIVAVITAAFNYYLLNKNYRNEFYKQIISRKIEAHQYLESYFLFFMEIKKKNELEGLGFRRSEEFEKFDVMTDQLRIHSFWFSAYLDEQTYYCWENVRFLRAMYEEKKIDPFKVKKFYENLDNTINTMKQTHYDDFLKLYKVRKFIKEKPNAQFNSYSKLPRIEVTKSN